MAAEKTPPTMIEDFIALQKALPIMPKDTSNPFFKSKYTSLDTITELIFPIMLKFNFAWVTRPSTNEQGLATLKYSLMHVSGTNIDGEMLLMLSKADPQGQGSAITYARRYSLTSVLGIVSDADDDGNAARAAAEAAKASDPHKAPEEPSRQVDDVPISNISLTKVKRAFAEHNMGGTAVTEFCQFIIGKPSPTTESDAEELIKALDAK